MMIAVTPAKAGAQLCVNRQPEGSWIPAFAGMTGLDESALATALIERMSP